MVEVNVFFFKDVEEEKSHFVKMRVYAGPHDGRMSDWSLKSPVISLRTHKKNELKANSRAGASRGRH